MHGPPENQLALRGLLLLALLALGACASVPSPLAPGVQGSVGGPAFGVLTRPVALPDSGPGFRRLRPWTRRQYGTSTLIRTLTDAAARGVAPGDPPLLVGDLAGPQGGPLGGHHSHRTGRDVDLLFFYTTPGGVPVEAPGFVHVGPDGLAEAEGGVFVRFDVPRNWRLVRALMTGEEGRIQWIFVVKHLKGLLMEHARALGEPPELLWRAQNVLHQPGDSSPHDDHFHLRIACSDDEAVAGCVTGAPRWPWWPGEPVFSGEITPDEDL
ncbi:MAG: penicillin-insensitive murein endopeptidase [Polyangiaceae bacterium]|jgi:penicillin-insensitive murein endopeptidase|nr:penicillin-insensitive murein endopeptidase [Polyangiaceae bacterium]